MLGADIGDGTRIAEPKGSCGGVCMWRERPSKACQSGFESWRREILLGPNHAMRSHHRTPQAEQALCVQHKKNDFDHDTLRTTLSTTVHITYLYCQTIDHIPHPGVRRASNRLPQSLRSIETTWKTHPARTSLRPELLLPDSDGHDIPFSGRHPKREIFQIPHAPHPAPSLIKAPFIRNVQVLLVVASQWRTRGF